MASLIQFDGNLLIGIQQTLNADWLTPIMKFISKLGDHGYFWIAVCLVLIIIPKTRRLGIICSLSLLLTFICCNLVIKPSVDRVRPWIDFAMVNRMAPGPGDASFPSGHSANSMAPAFAIFLATMAGKPSIGWKGRGVDLRAMHRVGIAAVVVALLIGLSRLYLGMHYPTDVFCGLLLGIVCAIIVQIVVTQLERRRGRIIGGCRD